MAQLTLDTRAWLFCLERGSGETGKPERGIVDRGQRQGEKERGGKGREREKKGEKGYPLSVLGLFQDHHEPVC